MNATGFNLKNLLNSTGLKINALPRLAWAIVVLAFAAGLLIRGGGAAEATNPTITEAASASGNIEWWTCSMHPQIKLPSKGQCPICFMDLIPLRTGGSAEGPGELKLSATAVRIAEIATTPVRRGVATADILLSGKVEYDETRVKSITAWVPGRLEHLFVDYTGISVARGDHLVELYSPELYAAQEELIQSVKQTETAGSEMVRESARLTLDAAREKLALLGLTAQQIGAIEKRGSPEDRLTIFSPISGVVIHKNAIEGMYVNTGTPIYTIADLSRIWIVLDAYEKDLAWLRFGQKVEFTTESLPGEVFAGLVAFIDPVLDNKTRTVKVRINLANPDGKLKPGLFIRAIIKAELDARGLAVNTSLVGKWICPMHPEVVKDGFGQCDVCGMDLVPAEKLGIVHRPATAAQPLLVPATAVLKTGRRALVYIRIPGRDEPTFVSREITVGPRAGEYYIVLAGLQEGEEVVTNGNFKIDSAMQIAAKPSMMNPAGGVSTAAHGHDGVSVAVPVQGQPRFRQRLEPLDEALSMSKLALGNSDFNGAREALSAVGFMAQKFDIIGLSDEELHSWRQAEPQLLQAVEHAPHWSNIAEAQTAHDQIDPVMNQLKQPGNTSAGHAGHE
ncbi:MAG: efflux RND transporter periplasmic adaptor subunit [Candidatus Neomarinimicrobiota bacterium]